MSRQLPSRANLRFLQEEAKDLLKAHRLHDASVCPILRLLHRFARAPNSKILSAPVALHDVQFALALDYGFAGWAELRRHVGSNPSEPALRLVHPESLAKTVDAVDEAFFFGRPLSSAQRREAALAITARQGLPKSYRGMFAPTEADLRSGFRMFTGERICTAVGTRHILGEEACRALLLLDVRIPQVQQALDRAGSEMLGWVREQSKFDVPASVPGMRNIPGMYCCMKCSVALWRHLAARKDSRHDAFLVAAVKALRAHRKGEGQWLGWPFYYALLALHDIESPLATEEMRYAAGRCEQQLKRRIAKDNVYSQRRRALIERLLARV